jgi:hypothetical protein
MPLAAWVSLLLVGPPIKPAATLVRDDQEGPQWQHLGRSAVHPTQLPLISVHPKSMILSRIGGWSGTLLVQFAIS